MYDGTDQHVSLRYKFTGKERDSESNLDYFGARYMTSTLGRFMSPDPGNIAARLADLTNPQSWNLYTYASNNPLRYIDPDGEWSTPVHEMIIDNVFGTILSGTDRAILKQASLYIDDDQSSAGAYKHGMRAGNIFSDDQTPDAARDEGEKFISDELNLAVNEQLKYENDGGKGNAPRALYEFGEALHTVTDKESPWHDHYKNAWYAGAKRSDWSHIYNESKYGPSRESEIQMAEYQAGVLWVRYQQMLKRAKEKKRQDQEKPKKLK